MKLIKGKSFKLAGETVVPMKAECAECGKHFSFITAKRLGNAVWLRVGGIYCFNCVPEMWTDAMTALMSEGGFPYIVDRVIIS